MDLAGDCGRQPHAECRWTSQGETCLSWLGCEAVASDEYREARSWRRLLVVDVVLVH